MKKVLTANHAVSWAVKLARVNVIAAYPITPQSSVVEELSEMTARSEIPARFIHSESEHSALSSCIGAAMTGARAFTATSSQGLAYMHEMLHWAAGGRLPLVMAEVNRSLGPPWTIYTDQQDSLSQRDTGWMQFYCRDAQEVLDTTLICYRLAERVSLPAMAVLDAFVLSHTNEIVDIPEPELVDRFLPTRVAKFKLDPKEPHAFGGMMVPDTWMETRVQLQEAMDEARLIVGDICGEWEQLTGRALRPLSGYRMDDAKVAIVAMGTGTWTVELAVDLLRERGMKAGALRLWMFRPFPIRELEEATKNINQIFVIDRSCSFGHCGILTQECRSALYNMDADWEIFGLVGGLAGREIMPGQIADAVKRCLVVEENPFVNWIGRQNA